MTPVGWLLVAAGAALVALLFLLRRTRRRLGAREPPASVRVSRAGTSRPVAPLPPADMEAVPLPVTACPQCGSPAIRPLTAGEGGVAGMGVLLDRQRCPRCGYEGVAVVFDRREDYASFLRRLDLAWRAARGK